jgi:hypothetical protein
VFFRLLLGGLTQNSNSNIVQVGGSFLFFPIMLMIVFKQKYPKWWFDWICELIKFSYRALFFPTERWVFVGNK